ncbi:MAG TPA: cytochrome c oxidase subunit II [Afifellaceae bacterium]|nr:cytochrome c oxidase subunit II [Afifellaceae bacterium]
MLLPLLLLAGCEQAPLSAIDPAGPGAAEIAGVWWVMFWASLAITAGVVALALYASLRRGGGIAWGPAKLLIIGGGALFPLAVVAALLAYGVRSGHALLPLPGADDVFRVDITAHQWWWEVRYPGSDGGALHDANEIHIPVGRPVDFHITTEDVIHSFWVPRLGGKIDAIPGQENVVRLRADSPGVYRGQCSEFCGAQHARMGFHVVAHDEAALEERLSLLAERSRDVFAEPPGAGAELFVGECAHCHSLDSREPLARIGPNLAGVADRRFIGAGWLANRDGAIREWLRAHQRIKPGNRMPVLGHLSNEELDALAAFLGDAP